MQPKSKRTGRLLTAVMILALAAALALPAAAAAPLPQAAYIQGQTMYIFFHGLGDGAPQLNDREADSTIPLAENGQSVTYVLVVDRSHSTGNYLGTIDDLIDALAQNMPGCAFRLYSFSDNFSADTSEYDAEAIKTALRQLDFRGQTDIGYGAAQAVQKLAESQWAPGELYSLVLLTDGWSSGDESALPELSDLPPFLFSACILGGGGSPQELCALQELCSNGHYAGDGDGARAGVTIAQQAASLTACAFPLEDGEEEPFTLFWAEDGRPDILNLADIYTADGGAYLPPATSSENPPAQELPGERATAAPDESTDKEPGEKPDEGPPDAATDPLPGAIPKATESGALEQTQPTPAGTSPATAETAQAGAGPVRGLPLWAAGIIGLLGVAVIALILVLVLRRPKSASPPAAATVQPGDASPVPHLPASKNQPGAIPMHLEVLAGNALSSARDFYLKDYILIGSADDCDLVFTDEEVAAHNSRIFFSQGYLYIEDLGSPAGTALGGMRLYAPNRLRSGDEISIGNVLFRFVF